MPRFVLDASVVLARVLPDEERVGEAIALTDRASRDGVIVPDVWPLEVANILLLSERRGTMPEVEVKTALQFLATLPVTVDRREPQDVWLDTARLARRHRLTTYDASYLELALRLGLELATFDAALLRAATAEGVPLTA